MPSQPQKMSALLRKFKTLNNGNREKKFQDMAEFLSLFSETHQQSRQSKSAEFNLFDLLEIGQQRDIHTRILAWLLDAESSHASEQIFLERLVELCGAIVSKESLTPPYRVQTNLNNPQSRLDIAIYRPGEFLLAIDNTISGREGINQVDVEIQEMRRLGTAQRIPPERQVAIFLTAEGRSPLSGDPTPWQILSYPQLGEAFATLLPTLTDMKFKHFLIDWIETVTQF